MEDTTRIALAKHLANAPKLAPGVYIVNEVVTLSVQGTIKVSPSPKNGAKEPLPWKQVAALAWSRLSIQDRQDIIEAVNGARPAPVNQVEQELDAYIIREEKPRAGATAVTVEVVSVP